MRGKFWAVSSSCLLTGLLLLTALPAAADGEADEAAVRADASSETDVSEQNMATVTAEGDFLLPTYLLPDKPEPVDLSETPVIPEQTILRPDVKKSEKKTTVVRRKKVVVPERKSDPQPRIQVDPQPVPVAQPVTTPVSTVPDIVLPDIPADMFMQPSMASPVIVQEVLQPQPVLQPVVQQPVLQPVVQQPLMQQTVMQQPVMQPVMMMYETTIAPQAPAVEAFDTPVAVDVASEPVVETVAETPDIDDLLDGIGLKNDTVAETAPKKALLLPIRGGVVKAKPAEEKTRVSPKRVVPSDFADKVLQATGDEATPAFIMPQDLKVTFYPNATDFSGQTVKWIKAFSLKAARDPRYIIEIRLSLDNPVIQQQRLSVVQNILLNNGLSSHQLAVTYVNRPENSLILRVVRKAETTQTTQITSKTGKKSSNTLISW